MADIFTPAGEVFDGSYWTPETSRGVVPGGPTYYALQALTTMLEPNKPINDVVANGYVVPVGATSEKEWTSADISMALAVNDLIFLLNSGLCIAYVAQDSTHPTVFYWAFKPKSNARDTFQTYTAIMGQDINGGSAPGLQVNSIDFTASEKTLDVKAKGFGQVYSDTAVAPANPTLIPLVPLSVDGHDVYMATTYAGLAAGHLQDCFTSKWTIPERYNPLMTQDSTVGSFSSVVQKKGQKPTAEIQVDRASHAATYMAQLRSKGKGYCRMVSSGPQIGTTGINYAVQTTFPFQFHTRKNSQFQDADTATFGMGMIFDPTFLGGAWLDIIIATDMSPASCGLATQAGGGPLPTQPGLTATDGAATAG